MWSKRRSTPVHSGRWKAVCVVVAAALVSTTAIAYATAVQKSGRFRDDGTAGRPTRAEDLAALPAPQQADGEGAVRTDAMDLEEGRLTDEDLREGPTGDGNGNGGFVEDQGVAE